MLYIYISYETKLVTFNITKACDDNKTVSLYDNIDKNFTFIYMEKRSNNILEIFDCGENVCMRIACQTVKKSPFEYFDYYIVMPFL